VLARDDAPPRAAGVNEAELNSDAWAAARAVAAAAGPLRAPLPPQARGRTEAAKAAAEAAARAAAAAPTPADIALARLRRTEDVNGTSPRDLVQLRVFATHERAKARQTLGDHAGALCDFSAVLDSCPNLPSALLRRGMSFKATGSFDAAAADFEAARRLRPQHPAYCLNYLGLAENPAIVLCAAGEEEEVAILGVAETLEDLVPEPAPLAHLATARSQL